MISALVSVNLIKAYADNLLAISLIDVFGCCATYIYISINNNFKQCLTFIQKKDIKIESFKFSDLFFFCIDLPS